MPRKAKGEWNARRGAVEATEADRRVAAKTEATWRLSIERVVGFDVIVVVGVGREEGVVGGEREEGVKAGKSW